MDKTKIRYSAKFYIGKQQVHIKDFFIELNKRLKGV